MPVVFRNSQLKDIVVNAGAIVGPASSLFTPYDGSHTLAYFSAYLSDEPALATLDMGSLDSTQTGPNFYLTNSDFGVSFISTGAVTSIYNATYDIPSGGSSVFEVQIGGNANLSIGLVSGSIDPTLPNGGAPTYVTYLYDGSIDVSGSVTSGFPVFSEGDIIGVSSTVSPGGYGDTTVKIYLNGVAIYTVFVLSFYSAHAMITEL